MQAQLEGELLRLWRVNIVEQKRNQSEAIRQALSSYLQEARPIPPSGVCPFTSANDVMSSLLDAARKEETTLAELIQECLSRVAGLFDVVKDRKPLEVLDSVVDGWPVYSDVLSIHIPSHHEQAIRTEVARLALRIREIIAQRLMFE